MEGDAAARPVLRTAAVGNITLHRNYWGEANPNKYSERFYSGGFLSSAA